MEKGLFGAALAILAVLAMAGPAHAHRLIPKEDCHADAEHAIPIGDVGVSQVVYHYATEDCPQVWLTFDAEAGQEIFMQIAIPVIERQKDYRPTLVLIGPGLPAAELPFAIPEGMGALVYPTEGFEGEYFLEHFTGTESWQLREETVNAAASGTHYVMGFHPQEAQGKFWIAVGTAEEFGVNDILSIFETVRIVRDFHEQSGPPFPLLWLLGGIIFALPFLLMLLLLMLL